MKKISVLLMAGAIFVFMAGCGAADSNDPNTVLKSFFELMAKKDIDGASKLATKDSKTTLDMVKKGMDLAETMKDANKENDPVKEFQNVEIGKARIEGDKAFVMVTNKAAGKEAAEFTLVKEDGRWKVDFSMSALMKMGKNQINKVEGIDLNNPHPGDSEFLNTDELKHSLEVADSVLKNIDPKKLEEIQKGLEKLKTE